MVKKISMCNFVGKFRVLIGPIVTFFEQLISDQSIIIIWRHCSAIV